MDNKTKAKIAKVYELVRRGIDGEKGAAEAALDRLMKKHNIDEKYVAEIHLKQYRFKYANKMELMLMDQLLRFFLKGKSIDGYRSTIGGRNLVLKLEYLDYVVIECAYEYFRKHMRDQFNKICLPKINRCRSLKTKNKRRKELQMLFFGQYIIASKLYEKDQVKKIDLSNMSAKEIDDFKALNEVKGGRYNAQMTTGLYLEA